MTSTVHHILSHTNTAPAARRDPAGRDVRLSSYPRPPAMVIEIGGEIDASNAQHVADYLVGFLHADRLVGFIQVDPPLVLDLRGVDFLGTAGFRVILRFAEACHRARRQWALVSSDAVRILLRVAPNHHLPVAGSLDAALQRFRRCRSRTGNFERSRPFS
jgi:anti-anti-sigma factor